MFVNFAPAAGRVIASDSFLSFEEVKPRWPQETLKIITNEEGDGRGGGDRTHDLRLKRPLLYH
jgi:hypothetical protein